ncbi:MAG TPA: metallophosphoesterase, partial [Sphingobacteriaceae bacterium]
MSNLQSFKIFFSVSLLFIIVGCITSKSFYDKKHLNWEKSNSPDSLKLKYSVFLIGDAGLPDDDKQEPTFKLLQSQLYTNDTVQLVGGGDSIILNSRKEDAVIFLGDNIYETGLPEPDASDRKEKERRIIEQMKIVQGFKGRTIFVPGNHDWNESRSGGLEAINREEQFIESFLDSADIMLPSNGCSGPVEVPMGDDLVIIAIDTEWWLHKYSKPLAPDNGCTAGSRFEVIQQIRDILLRNKGKNIVLAQHHPLFTNGKHGGFHTLKDYIFPLTLVRDRLFIPLPVIGSIYPLMRQYGISRQDVSNKDYQQLKNALLSILEEEKNVVIAAGHEHALQYNKYNDIHHIISGAGTKANSLAKGQGATFGSGSKGFARLNYYENGQCWVEFWTPEGDGSTGKLLFRTPLYAIPPQTKQEIVEEKQINYQDSVRVIAAGEQYSAGPWKEKWFGEHYRDTWATPIKVKYLVLATYAGGLTPIKLGGGKQTTSLQFQGKDGNLYQFRTISKDPSSLLPEGFARTFADDFVQDQISSAHPYGGLIVPGMAKAVGVFNVSPELVYMPHSRILGPYLDEVGGKLGTIEARPDEDVSDFKIFGNANNAISTRKLYEELREDNDNMVDQEMFLRARLFDILIGDWDRHEDQWRWAEFKTENRTLYKPIARDRDQAFPKYDGILPGLLKMVIPDVQSFEQKFGDIALLSIAARNLDRNFLNELSSDKWLAIARDVQSKLTDDVIEQSVRKMPKEAFDKSGQEIIDKLKLRRSQLVDAAKSYYRVLAQEVTISGSDKKEFFLVDKQDSTTRVRMYKINKKDKVDTLLYDRVFRARETKEINLYALNGKDSLLVKGRSK